MNNLTLNGIKNSKNKFVVGKNCEVIVDTGTSYILMPMEVRRSLLLHIVNTTSNVSCDNLEEVIPKCQYKDATQFPDLVLSFNTLDGEVAEYIIPRESYLEGDYVKIISFSYMDEWILGLNFLDNYYTAFDQENKRVGFALKKGSEKRIKEIQDER